MGLLDNLKTISESASKPLPPPDFPVLNKVLIVEDDTDISDSLAAALSSSGLTIAQAANGQIGLDMTKSFNPNVILLDINMPVMDGISMLRELRRLPQFKNLPIIILTNAGNIDNLRSAKTLYGVSDFLIKSNIEMYELIAKIKALLPHSHKS
jgi:two-component system chemotaxis response regulator CheY